jgi:hypothetical protein
VHRYRDVRRQPWMVALVGLVILSFLLSIVTLVWS